MDVFHIVGRFTDLSGGYSHANCFRCYFVLMVTEGRMTVSVKYVSTLWKIFNLILTLWFSRHGRFNRLYCSYPAMIGMLGERKYSSTHSRPVHYIELSGQLHALAALPAGNNCDTHRIESRVAPEKVWTFWRKEKFLIPTGIRNPDLPSSSVAAIFRSNAEINFQAVTTCSPELTVQ